MARDFGFIIGVALACAACGSRGDDSGAQSVGALDESKVIHGGVVARCTVTATGEGFFRRDTFHCDAEPRGAFPLDFLTLVEARSAQQHSNAILDAEHPWDFSFAAQSPGGASVYPFNLSVELTPGVAVAAGDSVQTIAPTKIQQTIPVTGPTSEPIVFRLPIDYWPISLRSSGRAIFNLPERSVSVDPWNSNGQSSVTLARLYKLIETSTPVDLFLAVAPGTQQVTAQVTIDDTARSVVIDGPGGYAIGAAGLFHDGDAPAPPDGSGAAPSFGGEPEAYVACYPGADSIDGKPILCASRPLEGVTMQVLGITVIGADGSKSDATMPGANATSVTSIGACVAKPCSLQTSIVVQQVGTSSMFLVGDTTLPLDDAATAQNPTRFRLPFNLWTLHLDTNGQNVVSLEFQTNSNPVVFPGWVSDPQSQGLVDVSVSPTASVLIPVAASATQVTGSGKWIDVAASSVVDVPFVVERNGSYRFTDDKQIVPVTP